MKPAERYTLTGLRDLDFVKILSHLFVIGILILFLYETRTLSTSTAAVPQLIIASVFILLAIHYFRAYRSATTLRELLLAQDANADDVETDTTAEAEMMKLHHIHWKPFAIIAGWLLSFSVSAFLIDFFLSVFIFCLGYLFWKTRIRELLRRLGYSIGGATLITVLIWIIMIEILERTLLIDIGVIDIFELFNWLL